MSDEFILGTVQLGLPYGIANSIGQPTLEEAHAILKFAFKNGIHTLDTAQSYGNIETILSSFVEMNPEDHFTFIHKLDPSLTKNLLEKGTIDTDQILGRIFESYELLGQREISTMLLHDPQLICHWDKLYPILKRAKENRWVKKIGISIYTPEEFQLSLQTPEIEAIQLPYNPLNFSYFPESLLELARSRSIQLYIRSVYLQGLLAMPIEKAKASLPSSGPFIDKWHSLCERHSISPFEAALSFVMKRIPHGKIILGVETLLQLVENIHSIKNAKIQTSHPIHADIVQFLIDTPNEVVDPRLWKKKG
jgi:uncharacterized protein